jgi:hypothetical protein
MENADEAEDGRADPTETIRTWWQPNDLIVTIKGPGHKGLGLEEIKITKPDLAGPCFDIV